MDDRAPRQRSWLEVRWRQLRNPPPPVVRAVLANLAVAAVGGGLLLAYDRLAAPAPLLGPLIGLYLVVVIVAGSALTYLWVELPTGASGVRRRSGWAALLGFFA